MRVVVLWRDGTDYARDVTDFMESLERRAGKAVESMDPDTREGASFAEIYDVMEFPAILALDEMGKVLARWQGTMLPRIDEVSYYMN